MNYSKLVNRQKEYKYSANLFFDLKSEKRLANFIPNRTNVEILAEYLYGIINGTNIHSRILYGSYGTGKSYILTVLCALLGHVNVNSQGFNKLIDSIREYDPNLAVFICDYIENSKPYLVVPVYSDYPDFDKCISFSLKKELEKNGIHVVFKSYYQEAISLLKKWKSGKESKARLEDILLELNLDYKSLCKGLEHYDSSREAVFDLVFKKMTFGASFVCSAGNLEDNLDAANEAISEGYSGIVFVFDEFGRYVEDEGENIRVKSIQELAEYCDHSEYNNYIVLVSHKQLSLYTERMSASLSNEWKKVEGRFKDTSINVKYDQCLSLIPHIIPKTKEWNKYSVVFKDELNEMYSKAYDFKGFMLPPEGKNPFEGGFPLHPISLFSLDRLSKRVAQNERTFFTFLSSDEENGLFDVLSRLDASEFHFVGLDSLFDYFEPNIRTFRSGDVYEVYKKYQFALNKLEAAGGSDTEIKILKTISVISIISDSSVLVADKSTLKYVVDENDIEVEKAIDSLEKRRIVKFMRQFGYYDFLDSSIYDFESMIEEKIDSVGVDSVITELNESFINFVVYPYEYNTDYHMTRVFVPVFALAQDINKKSFLKSLPTYYDGVVGMILDEDFDSSEPYKLDSCPERMILLVNTKPLEIIYEVKRLIAIKHFYSKRKELSKEDPTAERELSIYLSEQESIVKELIKNWRVFAKNTITTVYDAEIHEINSEKDLSMLASQIMYHAFPDTIVVNNDLINKNTISGSMNSSRNRVIEALIDNNGDIEKEFTPMSPEHTIVRSILYRNGFVPNTENCQINTLPCGVHKGENSGIYVEKEIIKYFKKCEKAQRPFSELYEVLKQEPYGLRDGYIAVLVAFELRRYENVGLYFHGTEKDYDVEEFVQAMRNPEDYCFYLCKWSDAQRDYIAELEKIYKDYIGSSYSNRLKEIHKAMNIHYSNIPKIARSTDKYLSVKAKKYRDIMSITHKDYYKFFFEDLLAIETDFESLRITLAQIRNELENVVSLQLKEVEKTTIRVLAEEYEYSIANSLCKKFESSWNTKLMRTFDYQTNAFLEYVQNLSPDKTNEDCVMELSKQISRFEIDYWNDSTIVEYEEVLTSILSQLNEYEVAENLSDNEYEIVLRNGNNEEITTRFDHCELSVNGQIMLNKIKSTIDSLGKGVTQEEKMVIIAKLISEIK